MNQRILTYAEAIREATRQAMIADPAVRTFGICIDDHRGFYGTVPPAEVFGRDRIRGTPLSEDALTGAAIGAAMVGGRIVLCHERFEYVLLTANQLINFAAKVRYMSGGAVAVPIVVRAVIGRSWGQGAQHSQGLQSLFAHIPGLKVIAPVTAHDAKGGLTAAIRDDNPVIFVEHRLLHSLKGEVPEKPYAIKFGQARLLHPGSDITLVGISYMAVECLRAARLLEKHVGISAEVVDPVSLSPLDLETITASVARTGRLLVADTAWTYTGLSAEIGLAVVEALQGERAIRVKRMGFAPVPCPPAQSLERHYYPNARSIAAEAYRIVHEDKRSWEPPDEIAPEVIEFRGPF